MKRLLLALVFILCSIAGFSQASRRTLNYQAVIIDPSTKDIPGTGLSNQPYSNGKLCIRFSFYNPQKQLEYEETRRRNIKRRSLKISRDTDVDCKEVGTRKEERGRDSP